HPGVNDLPSAASSRASPLRSDARDDASVIEARFACKGNIRGVIGFVTNASFIDGNALDGLRACLTDEFTSIYVFNLRGNQRTSGELSRQEGGKIFGSGSRAPIAITLLVKNPSRKAPATLRYHDIGDYLDRNEKLKIIRNFASIGGIDTAKKWTVLTPNAEYDWINQRNPAFDAFFPMGDKSDEAPTVLFESYSQGINSARAAWVFNFKRLSVTENVSRMIDFYNQETERYESASAGVSKNDRPDVDSLVSSDPKKISWARGLKQQLERYKRLEFEEKSLTVSLYRPFCKQWVYFNRNLNEMVYRLPSIFPVPGARNLVIALTGKGVSKEPTACVVDCVPDVQFEANGQCFPLYLYEPAEESGKLDLGKSDGEIIDGYRRRDAITDGILKTFRAAYGKGVSKEDIFYYVYGVLHSPEYRRRFAADLKKMLPRIPLTKEAKDFKAFADSGRELAKWHLNYETVQPWPVEEIHDKLDLGLEETYKVQKMTFARPTPAQKAAGAKWDKTKIIYNSHITISKIPLDAYEYIVNGKPAIEWVMERYQVTRDKDSGIVNDPNDWCKEHDQPRYIIDLIGRVVRVSIETMKIVKTLPALNEIARPT
ncbi:MAG: hypothetical protein IT446_14875, partial [Phycisphaerales bacterium]|nr:hypothetical protein [Phycisphaerales bacterium]